LILALFVLVDLLGIFGAYLVAVPFLREFGLKRMLSWHQQPVELSGLEGAAHSAAKVVQRELMRFKPEDGACVIWGLVVIAGSYALHIVGEIAEHLSG
jgi:hypothetical protein